MKKLSVICGIMFVVGLIASSVLAQDCEIDDDCTVAPLLKCLNGQCVECIEVGDCVDTLYCNGDETCIDNICSPGVSPCGENDTCDEETDVCVFNGLMVPMDIKPGSCQSPLNVRSRGVLPVAILGSEEFDVTTIDPATILLTREGFEGVSAIRYSYEDVGSPSAGELCVCDDLAEEDPIDDGNMDLTLKFRVPELVEGLGLKDVESKETIILTINGTADSTSIMGQDCVRIINKPKWWQDDPKKPKKPKKGGAE